MASLFLKIQTLGDPAPDKLKFTNVNLYMKPENRQVERVTLMHRFINSCDSELTLEFANCAFILKAQNRIIIKWLLKGQGPVWMLVNEQLVILKHFN